MKKTITISVLLGFGAIVAAAPAPRLVAFPTADLRWETVPGGPEVSFVVGSKDAKTGPTAFFIKFKGGFDSGWQTHESAYTGVVVSGTVVETSLGQDAVTLRAGSYYLQTTVAHRTVCAAGADCLEYVHETGRFSFTPTDEAGRPLPRPAMSRQ